MSPKAENVLLQRPKNWEQLHWHGGGGSHLFSVHLPNPMVRVHLSRDYRVWVVGTLAWGSELEPLSALSCSSHT